MSNKWNLDDLYTGFNEQYKNDLELVKSKLDEFDEFFDILIGNPYYIKQNTNVYIAPGLIDIQINGYMGVDFSDQDLTPEMMRSATKGLWKQGVTSFLPTVITRDQDRLERSFTLLAEVFNDEEISSSIPGFHLEGPYISPVQGYGALLYTSDLL